MIIPESLWQHEVKSFAHIQVNLVLVVVKVRTWKAVIAQRPTRMVTNSYHITVTDRLQIIGWQRIKKKQINQSQN